MFGTTKSWTQSGENIKHIGWRNGAHIMWILWPAMAEERGLFLSCLLGTAFARISGDF